MASKKPRATALFEVVMWGNSKQVQDTLKTQQLPIDDNWTDYELLLTAIRKKRKHVVKILLEKGCRIQRVPRIDNSDTSLHYAVKWSDLELIELLLDKGACISEVDENGETPLCFAMKNRNTKVVDLLLSSDYVNGVNVLDNDRFSHLHIACIRNNLRIVEQFIDFGVDINDTVNFTSKEWAGYTPLHFAVENKSQSVVELLVRHGANLSIKNAKAMTPLHLAVQKQNDTIVDLILSSKNVAIFNPVDNYGLSHFHIACMKKHLSAVKKFLQEDVDVNHAVGSNQPKWPGYTPLHFAVKDLPVGGVNNIPIIELLLHCKADVTSKDAQGQTPLHLACLQSDQRIAKLLKDVSNFTETYRGTNHLSFCELSSLALSHSEQLSAIELLLKYKSNVNVKNVFDETPIFYIYKNDRSKIATKGTYDNNVLKEVIKELNVKRKEILQILLKNNADVNVQNHIGQTILHFIAGINKEYDDHLKEVAAVLVLARKANVNARDKNGLTPLHIAAKLGRLKLVEIFLKFNADVNCTIDSDQSTPLHLATLYQQINTINILLQNDADVTMAKCNGTNVLHLMAMKIPKSSEIESYKKIITSFIDLGCDINAQTKVNGSTPLHLAVWAYNTVAIWILLRHFADINVKDYSGETPISFHANSSPSRRSDLYFMFKDYVDILRIGGLHVSKRIDASYTKLYGREPPDLKDDFLDACREEIEEMKSTKISKFSTVYDMLFKSSDEMEIHASDEFFDKFEKCENFVQTFPVYGNLLKSQFRKRLARKVIVNDAEDALKLIIGVTIQESCLKKIVQYLDNISLTNLIKAKSVSVPVSHRI
ncbi:ankyrin-1-like [Nasonia vitripennis]|uniref:Uncharacterized protein n=1 Tax=Nasonia vitripennis TaxID=7425 RepID=A0A7M7HCD9_NASVI|nr:ankyrin-1-like [Nasonia vitripennis]